MNLRPVLFSTSKHPAQTYQNSTVAFGTNGYPKEIVPIRVIKAVESSIPSDEFVDTIKKAIPLATPMEYQKFFADTGFAIHLAKRGLWLAFDFPISAYAAVYTSGTNEAIINNDPRGTWARFIGIPEIHLDPRTGKEADVLANLKKEGFEAASLVRHEFGHVLDYLLGKSLTYKICRWRLWRSASCEDLRIYRKVVKRELVAIPQEEREKLCKALLGANPQKHKLNAELWAELNASCIPNPSHLPMKLDPYKKFFRRTRYILKQRIKEKGLAVASD